VALVFTGPQGCVCKHWGREHTAAETGIEPEKEKEESQALFFFFGTRQIEECPEPLED
jgi:hypothetical protein